MFEKDENKQKEAGVAHSKKSFSVEGGSNPVGFNKIVPKNNSSFRLVGGIVRLKNNIFLSFSNIYFQSKRCQISLSLMDSCFCLMFRKAILSNRTRFHL